MKINRYHVGLTFYDEEGSSFRIVHLLPQGCWEVANMSNNHLDYLWPDTGDLVHAQTGFDRWEHPDDARQAEINHAADMIAIAAQRLQKAQTRLAEAEADFQKLMGNYPS